MTASAIWRRLDLPGHDAARVSRTDDGWQLKGCAVFRHDKGAAQIDYSVTVDRSWATRAGSVQGFIADRGFAHTIAHTADGWHLNGILVEGLNHLVDLDYGFTPATNLLQLRRRKMAPGERVEVPVAWFDVDEMALTELPQVYQSVTETLYQYSAPTVGYEGQLELVSRNGFIRTYPRLWIMEA